MAVQDIHHRPSILSSVRNALSALSNALIDARSLRLSAEARAQKIQVLQSKSDEELREMGLRRDEIASYVFRDLMYA